MKTPVKMIMAVALVLVSLGVMAGPPLPPPPPGAAPIDGGALALLAAGALLAGRKIYNSKLSKASVEE